MDSEPTREDAVNLALAAVAEAYSKIEEVSSIYVSRYLDDLTITILLRNPEYSRALMDKLLRIEYQLHRQNASVTMEFLYVPKLYEDAAEVIHPKAVLIYDRATSGIISRPSLSSAA